MMKKILIFTVSAGGGHNQAAFSLEQEFKQHDYQVVKLDALKETNKILDSLVTDGYRILANNFPKIFGELYKFSNNKKVNYGFTNLITSIIQDEIYQLLIANKPDLIVTTHPFIVSVIGTLKEKQEIIIPFISIVTDYKVHQTYIHDYVDAYITGSYHTKLSIINRGVSKDKIYTYGIPIRKEFFDNTLKEKRDDEVFTILLMGGSMGVKSMDKVLNSLVKSKNKMKIFAICGNNQSLKTKIESNYQGLSDKEIIIYGFTKNIPELMDAADIVITKPGGLTVSESIAKNIPMIIPYLIPGQEEENTDFLVESNIAIRTDKIKDITQVVDQLIDNPQRLEQMKHKMNELSKIHSTNNIVKLAEKLIYDNQYERQKYRHKRTDILILSASFGLGHKTVSRSIKEHLLAENNDLKIRIVDLIEVLTPQLSNQIYKGYEMLIRTSHEIYNYFYQKKTSQNNSQIDNIFYKLYLSKISKYIFQINPKLIISTFPSCSGFVSEYKKEYHSNLPLITCITDVVDNWEWIFPKTDRYLVATEKLKEDFVNKGINKDMIKVTGIPVKKDFLNESTNISIDQDLQITEGDFVILMMGGGIGLLPDDKMFYDWLDHLDGVTTIILTGKNQKAYESLTKKTNFKQVRVLDFTERVPELMKIADIIVTKAGGVSLFEAINSELPIIAYNPVLGQEIENSKFILESGIGVVGQDITQLKQKINEFITNNQLRTDCQKNMQTIRQTFAVNNLAEYILELYPRDSIMENL